MANRRKKRSTHLSTALRSIGLFTLLVIAVLAAANIGSQANQNSSSPPPDISNVVLLATNSVALKQGAEVLAGDIVVNAASPGPTLKGGAELDVGKKVALPSEVSLRADSIRIARRARVASDLFYNELLEGATTGSEFTPLDLPVFAVLPRFKTGTPGPDAENVIVARHAAIMLPPGDYGDITVKRAGTISFEGGVYNVRSIQTGRDARLVFLARSEVRVQHTFRLSRNAFVGRPVEAGVGEAALPTVSDRISTGNAAFIASDTIFYVAGINGRQRRLNLRPAAELGKNTKVFANFYVPNGTLVIKRGATAVGAFFARDVLIGKSVRLDLASAFGLPIVADDVAVETEQNMPATIALTADAPPDISLTFSIAGDPSHGSLSNLTQGIEVPQRTASVIYAPEAAFFGEDSFLFQACNADDPSECDTAKATVTVTEVNHDPEITSAPVTSATVGELYTYDVAATDDDGDPLRFSLMGAPAGMAIDQDTGMVTWTPDGEGDFPVVVKVNDNRGGSASQSFSISVSQIPTGNRPPELQPIGDQTIPLGTTLRLALDATDPNGDPVTFSASPLPLPANSSLGGTSGVFEFKPDESQIGQIELTFTASDGLLTDSEIARITVQSPDPNGVTALSGRILDTTDFVQGQETPVVGATVSILSSGVSTTTDQTGRFLLDGLPAGSQLLDIDPSTAAPAPDGSPHAGFREEIALIEHVNNIVERPFFLPRLDPDSLTTIDPNATTTVKSTKLGVSFAVPPHTAKNPDGTDFTGQLSISEVPEGLAPAALADELRPGLLITIQPVGVTFAAPVPITFPNIDQLPPNSETDIWSLDPATGGFVVVGTGRVSADGSVIETVSGGIRAADWHFILPILIDLLQDLINNFNLNPDNCLPCELGSKNHVNSGNFSVEHRLAGYRSLGQGRRHRLIYNSLSADPKPIITVTPTISPVSAVPDTISSNLTVNGITQGQEVFTGTSGLDETAFETLRFAFQIDGTGLETGLYPYSLTLRNNFRVSSAARTVNDTVLINNQIGSPFGAGWTLAGVSRLHEAPNGDALVTLGNGGILAFSKSSPGRFRAPTLFSTGVVTKDLVVGDFNRDGNTDIAVANLVSDLSIHLGDGSGEFATRTDFGGFGTLESMALGDFNEDGILDIVMAQGESFAITLGDGTGAFLPPTFFQIPPGTGFLASAQSLTVADFNEDSNLDVATANINGNDITVFLGDGAGSFGPANSFPFGEFTNASGIVAGDFTGDQTVDLVTANNTSLKLFVGDGSGSFAPPVKFTGVTFALSLVAGDFNRDGWLDVATTGSAFSGESVFVLLNNRVGGFLPPRVIPTRALPKDIAAADLDNDGLLDLAVINENDSVSIFFGDGTGAFSEPIDLPPGLNPKAIALGDFDGNGSIDISMSSPDNTTSNLAILLNGSPSDNDFPSPAGDFSVLVKNPDGTFTRKLKDGTQIQFDAEGLQTAVVDRNGNTTSYQYNAAEQLVSITDPVSLVTRFSYINGHIANITDPAGRVTMFDHDAGGNLTRITDLDGSIRRFDYDDQHRMTMQVSKRQFENTYEYDFAGRNIEANRADGSTRTVSPSETFGLIDSSTGLGTENNPAPFVRAEDVTARFTDGNGQVTTFETNRFGSGTGTLDALGRRTQMTRDADNNPTRIVNPNGAVTDMQYDFLGNLISLKEAVGDALERETRFEYEPTFSQLTKITDPAGKVTTIEYDDHGNPTNITNALGGARAMTYDGRGLLLTRTDENGNATAFSYDAKGNLVTITDAESNVTRFDRDSAGNIVAVTEGLGTPEERTSTFTYDALNRLSTSTDGTGAATTFRYDAAGNVVETESPTGEIVRRGYDEADRVVSIDDPVTGLTLLEYDGNGNLKRSIDALNNATVFEYDAVDQVIKTTDPRGGIQTFEYDVQGNLTALTDARGQKTTFGYDLLNRQIQRTNPLGQGTTFTYDMRNNLQTRTDAKGQTITNSYDDLSRLTTIGAPDNTTTFAYDAVGSVLTVIDDDSSLAFTYDSLNRVATAQTLDVGFQPAVTLTNVYDAVGNRRQLLDTEGGTTEFGYDQAGRLTELTTPASDLIQLQHDLAGRLSRIVFPNTVVSDYTYDVRGRLESIVHTAGSSAILDSFTYGYNAVGNITSIEELTKTRMFDYDELQQLISGGTQAEPEFYTYDAVGNRETSFLSTAHVHDAANRLLEDDDFTYTYDANGNLETKTAKADGSVTSFTFNSENELVRIDFPDGTSAEYRYDGLGRRIEKDVNGAVTRYVYDGQDILLEYGGTNVLAARYSHGDRIDQPLSLERGGQRFFYQTDQLGSIRQLTGVNGSQVNSYEYDSYGRLANRVESVPNPFTFTGREFDAESGLYYYRARYYDPQVGRFISEDPLTQAISDLYNYVGSRPISFVDPLGLDSVSSTAKTGGAAQVSLVTGEISRSTTLSYDFNTMTYAITTQSGNTGNFDVGVGSVNTTTLGSDTRDNLSAEDAGKILNNEGVNPFIALNLFNILEQRANGIDKQLPINDQEAFLSAVTQDSQSPGIVPDSIVFRLRITNDLPVDNEVLTPCPLSPLPDIVK